MRYYYLMMRIYKCDTEIDDELVTQVRKGKCSKLYMSRINVIITVER